MGTFGLQIAFLAVHTAVSLMYRSAGYWVTSRHGWVCVGRVGSSSISSKRAVLHPGQVYLTLAGKGLTPFPGRAMASTRGLAMAEPSAGRVAVEVIVTLNHCTELATGTTATGGMLGVDVRCRVAIVVMLKADAVAPCASRHST